MSKQNNPLALFSACLIYIIFVLSCGAARLPFFFFFPAVFAAWHQVPLRPCFIAILKAVPFVITVAAGGLVFAPGAAAQVAATTLILRSLLVVFTLAALSQTIGFSGILTSLKTLRFPPALLAVLEMLHSFFHVLADRAAKMRCSLLWRSGASKLQLAQTGSFLGNLFLTSYHRSQNLVISMSWRGVGLAACQAPTITFSPAWAWVAATLAYCLFVRLA